MNDDWEFVVSGMIQRIVDDRFRNVSTRVDELDRLIVRAKGLLDLIEQTANINNNSNSDGGEGYE